LLLMLNVMSPDCAEEGETAIAKSFSVTSTDDPPPAADADVVA